MLLRDEVLKRVDSGEIRICYAFELPSGGGMPQLLPDNPCVTSQNPESAATRAFDRYFFGDRLGIALGPIVLSHNDPPVAGRVRFRGTKGMFDLRETQGKIDIQPGESLTVSSIEQITLGPKTGALILPRLSVATAGLVVTPTYIDPLWDGILQLHLVNLSPHIYTLEFGERVAICRFYPMVGSPVAIASKDDFARKSHHYGLNWTRILSTDQDPQPLRKKPVTQIPLAERAKRRVREAVQSWEKLLGVALATTAVAGLIGYGRLQEKLDNLAELEKQSRLQAAQIDSLTVATTSLNRQIPATGSVVIVFPAGQMDLSRELALNRPVSAGSIVWLDIQPAGSSVVGTSELAVDPTTGKTVLTIVLARRADLAVNQLKLRVNWFIASQ